MTKVTDPKTQLTMYGYDLLSRLRTVTQSMSQVVSYDYDARGRLSKTTNARDQALLYRYFSFGGLKEVVHDLDDDGEEVGERKISYTYDANGNVLTVRDTAVSWVPGGLVETFTYDGLDRVDTVTAHYIGGDPLLDARYDRVGNRDELTLSDGATLRHQWAYDKRNRLVAACLPQDATTAPCIDGGASQTLDFSYLGNDRLDQLTHGNGLVTEIDHHPYGPIQQIAVGSTPFPQKLVYTHDELLNVDTIAETQNGTLVSPSFDFAYDAVYRLTEADYPTDLELPPAPGESFGYDEAGNRDDDPSSATPWAYDANNELTRSPNAELYCYDADGNLTSTRDDEDTCASGDDIRSFSWDAHNRLLGFSEGSTSAAYAYDPFGRRIRKSGTGGTTFYLWDGDRLLAEYDASGNRTVRYAYGDGFAPVQFARTVGSSEEIYDVHSDHLDTPRMLTDDAGVPSWRASYEAFGKAHVSSDPDGTPVTMDPGLAFNIRFPGQYFDAESGLHDNRFRYYAPDVGRYISADPIGQIAGTNLFPYVASNPLNLVDLLGLFTNPVANPQLRGWYGSSWAPQGSTFGPVRKNGTQFHQGVDIYAPVGTSVVAAIQGQVVQVADHPQFGLQVIIKGTLDGGTVFLRYSHLSQASVCKGQTVEEGTQIGLSGMTGNASSLQPRAAHLHFEIMKSLTPGMGAAGNANRINPGNHITFSPASQAEQQ